MRLTGKFRQAGGDARLAKNHAQVFHGKLATIVKVRRRDAEVRHFGAQIKLRARQLQDEIIKLEGIAMQREFRVEVDAKATIRALGEFDLPPLQATDVRTAGSAGGCGTRSGGNPFERKLEILPIRRERDAAIVDARAAVAEFETPDLKIEYGLLPRFIRRELRRG